jgi:mannobiose 2-epimerase
VSEPDVLEPHDPPGLARHPARALDEDDVGQSPRTPRHAGDRAASEPRPGQTAAHARDGRTALDRLREGGWLAVEAGLRAEAALRLARGLVPPRGSRTAVPAPAAATATTLERLLTENLLGFWDERVVDRDGGGYRLAFDRFGRPTGAPDRHLVTQGRTLWLFARLSRTRWARPEHLDWAEHGYRFLRDRLRDRQHGGFYWSIGPGADPDGRKHLYGQAVALEALLEYERAGGRDATAGDLADDLFELLDDRLHDGRYGGYHESFGRDWTPDPPGRPGLMGYPTGLKTMASHMHLMTALAALTRQRPSALARERLWELVVLLAGGSTPAGGRTCLLPRREDWTPVPPHRTSYGHDLESVWMLMDACAALGVSDGPLLPVFSALWDHALAHGFDHERGGFYKEGGVRLPAHHREKTWWVQAECLVSALRMHRRTGEPRYLAAFEATLGWIVHAQADWEHGDWHREVSRRGIRRGAKAGPWEDGFHQGRALVQCLEIVSGPG